MNDGLQRSTDWLRARAEEILSKAMFLAADGTRLWAAGGERSTYAGRTYPRDFYYTVAACPDAIPPDDLRNAIQFILDRQAEDGRIPNAVRQDGIPWYWLYDNSPFIVNLVHLYVTYTGDDAFFRSCASRLEHAMQWTPRNPATGLVYSPNPDSLYGFQDAILIGGDALFCSLLDFEAASKLADLYRRSDQLAQADRWERHAAAVRAGLKTLYCPDGYFLAAAGNNQLPDVWGSAFAVYIGAVSPAEADAIGYWLAANYQRCIQAGQVRHLLAPQVWEDTQVPAGVYQNGGYWATPFAWVNRAIRRVDATLADRMLWEVLADFQRHGINEVVNYDLGYVNRQGHAGEYCASLAPLISLRELGLTGRAGYANLACARHGGQVTASSVYRQGSDPRYQIEHLNDGEFGDEHAWIPAEDDPAPWVQIELAQPGVIDTLIFGRDRWSTGHLPDHQAPNRNGRADRQVEQFTVLASEDGTDWHTVYEESGFRGLGAGEDAVISLSPPVRVRFVRVSLQPNQACIDELQLYGSYLP